MVLQYGTKPKRKFENCSFLLKRSIKLVVYIVNIVKDFFIKLNTMRLIGCHLDVVSANADTWKVDPFKLTTDGDKLYVIFRYLLSTVIFFYTSPII